MAKAVNFVLLLVANALVLALYFVVVEPRQLAAMLPQGAIINSLSVGLVVGGFGCIALLWRKDLAWFHLFSALAGLALIVFGLGLWLVLPQLLGLIDADVLRTVTGVGLAIGAVAFVTLCFRK